MLFAMVALLKELVVWASIESKLLVVYSRAMKLANINYYS